MASYRGLYRAHEGGREIVSKRARLFTSDQIESFLGYFNEGVESICEFFTDYTLSNDKGGVPIAIAVTV